MTGTKNTVSDAILAHYIEYANLVGDNGTPAISTGELASMARELQSLRASIPGGVGVKVKPLDWTCIAGHDGNFWRAADPFGGLPFEAQTEDQKKSRDDWHRRRILSSLDLSPAEGEPVGLFRKTDGAWKQVPDEWADHPNVQPLYAAPSNPVISDEMVKP